MTVSPTIFARASCVWSFAISLFMPYILAFDFGSIHWDCIHFYSTINVSTGLSRAALLRASWTCISLPGTHFNLNYSNMNAFTSSVTLVTEQRGQQEACGQFVPWYSCERYNHENFACKQYGSHFFLCGCTTNRSTFLNQLQTSHLYSCQIHDN